MHPGPLRTINDEPLIQAKRRRAERESGVRAICSWCPGLRLRFQISAFQQAGEKFAAGGPVILSPAPRSGCRPCCWRRLRRQAFKPRTRRRRRGTRSSIRPNRRRPVDRRAQDQRRAGRQPISRIIQMSGRTRGTLGGTRRSISACPCPRLRPAHRCLFPAGSGGELGRRWGHSAAVRSVSPGRFDRAGPCSCCRCRAKRQAGWWKRLTATSGGLDGGWYRTNRLIAISTGRNTPHRENETVEDSDFEVR